MNYLDLSHPITDNPSCTFNVIDITPKVRFLEGESHGAFFITSKIDNLFSNFCTHIDFPGHLSELGSRYHETVGSYPIDKFIGNVICLDFSNKLEAINEFFNNDGCSTLDLNSEQDVMRFLNQLDLLEISEIDIKKQLSDLKVELKECKGLLIYSGLSKLWKYEVYESWYYKYFFGPFFSQAACKILIDADISFVGVDYFQVEHPIINFRGDEKPIVINPECRNLVTEKLTKVNSSLVHTALLGNNILIYENLKLYEHLSGKQFFFSGVPLNMQITGINDNALARPYAIIDSL